MKMQPFKDALPPELFIPPKPLAVNTQPFKVGLLPVLICIPALKLLLKMQLLSVGLLPWGDRPTLFWVKRQLFTVGAPPVMHMPLCLIVKPSMMPSKGTFASVWQPPPDREVSIMLWPGPAPRKVTLLLFQMIVS